MLEKYFEYKKHKTNFRTEVIAVVTTFLTMAYIMFLNPFILSGEFAGPEKGFFDFGAVFTATIIATAIACFIMAFYGKTWPIGLAPGMGINAFVAFGVVAGMGYTPQAALGAVLVARPRGARPRPRVPRAALFPAVLRRGLDLDLLPNEARGGSCERVCVRESE